MPSSIACLLLSVLVREGAPDRHRRVARDASPKR
jgi:hypothetical protein